jgi:hypothetical protein
MFNGTSLVDPGAWFQGEFREGMTLKENAWFVLLRQRGYRLHVVQSTGFRYLEPGGEGTYPGDTISEFEPQDLPAIARAPLTTSQKVPFLLGTYIRLSFFLKKFARGFDRFKDSALGQSLPLPDWHLEGTLLAPFSAMNSTEKFIGDLAGAGPGQAWLVHLLSPHSPFGFRGDCSLEPDFSRWLLSRDPQADPLRNTPSSRAARYPLYLEQMRCIHRKMAEAFDLLKSRGLWEDSLVIVHGDHGSRISLHQVLPANADILPASDYPDQFSTLFAVKLPGGKARYDSRQLPLDHLFGRMLLEGEEPGNPALEADPRVFLQERYDRMIEVPLPAFGRSLP